MATTNKNALTSSYALASSGACLIDLMKSGGTIKLWVGENQPAANVGVYHVLGYNEGGFSYTGTENVWIISNTGGTRLCVVTVVL